MLITMIGFNFENPFSYYPQTRITSIEESFFEIFKHIYILYKYKELIAVRKDTRK